MNEARKKIILYFIARKLHPTRKLICLIYIVMVNVLVNRYYEKKTLKNCTFTRHETRLSVLDNIIGHSDIECVNQLRMDRKAFGLLCELLRVDGKVKQDGLVSLEKQVCMFLYILAHHVKNQTIGNRFKRSGETISRYFNSVLNDILRLQGSLLRSPDPVPANCTDERWRLFKNCLGALDGTYIKVHVNEVDKPRYRTRKGELATNVLGVFDRNMMFVFVLPGWEGSASDSRVLRDAISRPNRLKIPTGYYYLVDAGYTNSEGFLAPFRGIRYHLSEWKVGSAPRNREEYFNMKHASARNIIERCFGLLKKRLAILRSLSFYPIKTQGRIITACCLLHNLIRREMLNDPIELEEDEMQADEAVVDHNPIGSIEASNAWNEWRNNLATQMYNEWRTNRDG